ncbi:MAG: phosphotransferase family protein [Deltaproteobacteria bacterium]|jgi:thiamine kinase-like enzyme|nr:phosphotransferase family protein [Deltaproteobacteria bacterium]
MIDLKEYYARIPMLKDIPVDKISAERLGGLTNVVYCLRYDNQKKILRIPGVGTDEFIDRKTEKHDAIVASDSGVSAKVLYFDDDDGLMFSEFLEGETLNEEKFRDLGSVERSAKALLKIHQHPAKFKTRFDVFEKIDEYLELVKKLDAKVPDGYDEVNLAAKKIRTVLESKPIKLVPCHCDPLAENFIDNGEQVSIVDWEYGGNNDPMWDLGDMSVEANFNSEQDKVLLESYFSGPPPKDQLGRMVIYKMLCDLLWTLWGVVQHANKNPVDDFWAYSVGRFERCQKLLADPSFDEHLAAI